MQNLRYVILGAGGIANSHVDAYKAQGVTPVGFQDISQAGLDRWKQRFPEAEVDTDPARLLAKVKPDIVSVCSPNAVHASLSIAGFAAGCHVLCEKPMAMNVDETLKMDAARRAAGKLGAINFSYRNNAAFRFAREVIAAGELGSLQRLNVRYLQSFLGAAANEYSWRNDIAIAGFGALGDLGVHMIDGASFISGLTPMRTVGLAQTLIPTKPDANGTQHKVTTDTNASFLVEYQGSAIGTFETSQVVPGYGNFFHIEVSGDKGVLRVCSEEGESLQLYAGGTLSKYGTWSRDAMPRVNMPTDFYGRQPRSTQESFVKAIRGESVEYADFDAGIKAQRVLGGIVESMKSGAWVTL
jgi:predicted dehydrogenase